MCKVKGKVQGRAVLFSVAELLVILTHDVALFHLCIIKNDDDSGRQRFFTMLHEIQTRSSDENYVRLSVCPSNA